MMQIRRQASKVPADERCVINLVGPPGFDATEAEAFAVRDFDLADEPIAGADVSGIVDLHESDIVPPLVAVKAKGAAVTLVEPNCPGARQVRLRPEATVSGVIRDRGTGLPVGGATVMLSLGAMRLNAVTTSTGSFTLSNIPSGVHRLAAKHRNKWGRSDDPLLIGEGINVTGVEIYLDAAYLLQGEVRSQNRSGQEQSVRIQLESPHLLAGGTLVATAGASGGNFEFGPIPDGEYKLIATGDSAGCSQSLLRHETTVSMRGRDQKVLLDVGARHQFVVVSVNEEGMPTAHVPFTIHQDIVREDGLISAVNRPASTDSKGKAVICGVAPGEMSIEAEGRKQRVHVSGGVEVRIVAADERRSRLGGRLVTEDGEPVALRDVLLIPLADPEEAQLSRSDDSGTFRFERLAPGRYRLDVRPRLSEPGAGTAALGLSRPPEVTEEVDIRVGEDMEADLVLEKTKNHGISGVVLDPHGKPVAGATVAYSIDQGGCWTPWEAGEDYTTSDADGRFAFDGMHGSSSLRVHAMQMGEGRGSAGDVHPGARDVQVRLSELGALRLRASGLRKFSRHSGYCDVSVVSSVGCNLAGGYLPSDGGPIVFDDLPVTEVTVMLKCLGQDAVTQAATVLEANEITDIDLLPL
jgi:protocatechuate 3,4-dioxygenase beta subunit